MAYTVDQLAVLEAAIAQGALKVKYADKEVTYRSLDEMIRIRDIMARSLAPATCGGSSRRVAEFHKGLG